MHFHTHGGATLPLLRRAAVILAVTAPLAACNVDKLLDIPQPDVADPRALADSSALPAFISSAIGDFSVAFDANAGDNQADYSGMLADEWINSETFPTRIQVDIRNMEETNSNLQAITRTLYRARTSAVRSVNAFHQFSPNNISLAESYNILAVSYMLFGENYCSGVPFSDVNADGSFTYGGQQTTTQIFTRALAAADSALAVATRAVLPATTAGTNARNAQLNFARVLRGRALLNLNDAAGAAAAVAAVPTTFSYVINHSENSAREYNGIYTFNTLNRRISLADKEGVNGLPYRSQNDPRLPYVRDGQLFGFDLTTPQWDATKYSSRSTPTVVASGVEARLIEAEAQARAGSATYLTILNGIPRGGAPALVDPGTTAGRVDQVMSERAFHMFGTSHRLGDMRRLIRQYARNSETVFPTGAYHKTDLGGRYGPDVNFPLSVDERNNPEFANIPSNQSLCINRQA